MRNVLVTGANKGLGLETARQLVAAGHRVTLGCRDVHRGRVAAARIGARVVQLDVTSASSVAEAAATVTADGGLDVLVNNAGVAPEWGEDGSIAGAEQVTAELMEVSFGTNVIGAVRVLHAFLPLLRESAAPVVVNVSSGLGSFTRATTPGAPGYAYAGVAYPASKAALNMVTVQFAKALPAWRINAVEPGFTATDLNRGAGRQSVEQGAAVIVAMALIGPDGPTGGLFGGDGPIEW